jgi:RNA 2',3'-cyclic 3'-phosphodiesterase
MRTFISFNLQPGTKEELISVQNEVRLFLKNPSRDFVKWENISNSHLTVFFIGEINAEKCRELISALDDFSKGINFKTFLFESDSTGVFPDYRKPRVLFAGLKNPGNNLSDFYEKLLLPLKAMGFEPDKKFHPHLTLARIKNSYGLNLKSINDNVKFEIKFSVSDFYLMESKLQPTGAVYKVIKSFSM